MSGNEIIDNFITLIIIPQQLGVTDKDNIDLSHLGNMTSFDKVYWTELASQASFNDEQKNTLQEYINSEESLFPWRQAMGELKKQYAGYNHPLFNIKSLVIRETSLQSFDGTGLTALQTLELMGNNLQSFDGTGLTALNQLILECRSLQSFDGRDLESLQMAYLSSLFNEGASPLDRNRAINGPSVNIDLRQEVIIDNRVIENLSLVSFPFVEKIHTNLLSHFISKNDILTALKVARSLKNVSDSRVFENILHQMYFNMRQEHYNHAVEVMNILHHFVPTQGVYSALLKNAKTKEKSL